LLISQLHLSPMPTIKPNARDGKLIVIRVATVAAGLLPGCCQSLHLASMQSLYCDRQWNQSDTCSGLQESREASGALRQETLLLQLAPLLKHISSLQCKTCESRCVSPSCEKDKFPRRFNAPGVGLEQMDRSPVYGIEMLLLTTRRPATIVASYTGSIVDVLLLDCGGTAKTIDRRYRMPSRVLCWAWVHASIA
jgi:hypothetical protein